MFIPKTIINSNSAAKVLIFIHPCKQTKEKSRTSKRVLFIFYDFSYLTYLDMLLAESTIKNHTKD